MTAAPGMSRVSSSMRAIASPVLRPGAAFPSISYEAHPLKRVSTTGERPHEVEAKAENGAMAPEAVRTYHSERSSGRLRNCASPCM